LLKAPTGPLHGAVRMLRHRAGVKARPPPIDCSLAVEHRALCDPFCNPDFQSLAERFEVLDTRGQGSTAVVYHARPRAPGSQEAVALKVMRISDEELLLVARAEFELLREITHPNIIRVLDFCTFPQGVVLVMDFFDGQSLKALMHDRRPCGLTEITSRGLFTRLMRAVDHLHENGIIHRDVKADNVLVDAQLMDLRLVDFNTAQRVASGALTMTGTADYMPPEVLFGEAHSEGSDIWACGLCLHLMITGMLPFVRSLCSSHAEFGRVVLRCSRPKLSGRHWEVVSQQCKEVVQSCLAISQEERPRACEVLASEWLCELPAVPWEVPPQSAPTEEQ